VGPQVGVHLGRLWVLEEKRRDKESNPDLRSESCRDFPVATGPLENKVRKNQMGRADRQGERDTQKKAKGVRGGSTNSPSMGPVEIFSGLRQKGK